MGGSGLIELMIFKNIADQDWIGFKFYWIKIGL